MQQKNCSNVRTGSAVRGPGRKVGLPNFCIFLCVATDAGRASGDPGAEAEGWGAVMAWKNWLGWLSWGGEGTGGTNFFCPNSVKFRYIMHKGKRKSLYFAKCWKKFFLGYNLILTKIFKFLWFYAIFLLFDLRQCNLTKNKAFLQRIQHFSNF